MPFDYERMRVPQYFAVKYLSTLKLRGICLDGVRNLQDLRYLRVVLVWLGTGSRNLLGHDLDGNGTVRFEWY